MSGKNLRVGIVGAGYIADWHAGVLARSPGLTLAGICDPNISAAQGLATAYGADAFDSLAQMMGALACDAVHICTPSHLHAPLAIEALNAGAHVLVEKPFATTTAEARAMAQAARDTRRLLAVNHNFLGLPSYQRLRDALSDGLIGRVDQAQINWHLPLQPLRTGPFGLWMLQRAENLMLELGPHLQAFAQDMFGPMQDIDLRLMRPITLPTGQTLPQGWRVQGRAGTAEICLSVSLTEGVDDRSVTLRGAAGSAKLDFAQDTLVVSRANTSDIIVNPLRAQFAHAGAHLREGARNAWVQARSLNRRQPYALGFEGVIAQFYNAIRSANPVPAAISDQSAIAVMEQVEAIAAQIDLPAPLPAPVPQRPKTLDCLVIGGTGFVGRELVRQLAAQGLSVGVLSRARANPFAAIDGKISLVTASLHDEDALSDAMRNVTTVYHLAKAEETSWDGYLKNDVAVTERLGRAALRAGVKRFVYSGTIASYDASDPHATVTEATPFGDMSTRNLYARSKALCEARLMAMHREQGLALVIARPGIVVGPGGPLQHWGIARWHGAGAARVWGNGRNILPFVLNEDVARAMVLMHSAQGIDGQSFNLIGPPMFSARDWFDAIARLTGTRISVSGGALGALWASDQVKYLLKRWVMRRQGVMRASLRDWRSRGHLSRFSNHTACEVLGWTPETDTEAFLQKAIRSEDLFGF